MVRFKKTSNLLDSLHRLEYGLAKDTYLQGLQAMRLLISDENSPFTLVERLETSKPVSYDEGKLYLDHCKDVKLLYGGGPADKPVHLYKLPSDFPYFRDTLVITHCQMSMCPLARKVYCPSFFAITEENHLIRLASETGELLDNIYLGSTYEFTSLSWETYGKRLVLQTDKHQKNKRKDTSILLAFCLMSIFPLEFVALFELETAVIGDKTKNANIRDGLLTLQPFNRVFLYDLCELISERNRICHCKLYEENAGCSHGPVGTSPYGLPINFIAERLPPKLFNAACIDDTVEFGATPYHYIYRSTRQDHRVVIAEASNDRVVANSESLNIPSIFFRPYFHWDDTGRIIHHTDYSVSIYKLIDDDTDGKKMQLQFKLKCDLPRKRTARQLAQIAAQTYNKNEGEVCELDYEGEMEYLVVLGVSWSTNGIGCIRIFDNFTGRLVRHIDLDITLKDEARYELRMDFDAIVLIETMHLRNTVFIYKLDRSSTG